jgi:hypothetical protein
MAHSLISYDATIHTETEVCSIDRKLKKVQTQSGKEFEYTQVCPAANQL